MQAEAEDGVWEVAPLAHGRTLAHLYGADAGLVRAELAVEAAPEGAAQPVQREDGSLADEIVTGDDLRPLHAAAADPGRAMLLTQPDVCSQVRGLGAGNLSAAPWTKQGWGRLQAVEEREAALRREALSYEDAEVVVEVVREGELAGATAFVGARGQ